uniref:Uncharacterized protein n=2 Tax=Oryza barthii TaxID=65489 RepID=A0A0D3FY01_9ORYZ
MSCLMLNHEGFSKSWKLSNSTRQSSCRNGEKYGEAAVKLLAATLRDQWALAYKRMHINNNWWRQKRRLVKSASCNYVTAPPPRCSPPPLGEMASQIADAAGFVASDPLSWGKAALEMTGSHLDEVKRMTSIAISLARCKAADFSDQRLIAKWPDPAAPLPRPPPRDRVDLAAPPPRPSNPEPFRHESATGSIVVFTASAPHRQIAVHSTVLPDHHLLQHHIVALDFCLIAVTETFINPRWPWYHDAAVTADTIPVMSCLMLNHEGFSKSWKLSNSTRQSSCRNGEKYGEAAVKLLAATLRDQWALAYKRMHINNNWWRQKRRLVKSASCNYVTGNLFAKHSIYCSAIASQR